MDILEELARISEQMRNEIREELAIHDVRNWPPEEVAKLFE